MLRIKEHTPPSLLDGWGGGGGTFAQRTPRVCPARYFCISYPNPGFVLLTRVLPSPFRVEVWAALEN